MKLSKTFYLRKLFDVIELTVVNMFLIAFINSDWIPFSIFLEIFFNSLLVFKYSLGWLPDVWAKETHLRSSFFGFKRNYNYEDLVKVSEANYRLFKQHTPIKLTFKNKETLIFTPNKNGLEYLLNIIKEKSLPVRIETPSSLA